MKSITLNKNIICILVLIYRVIMDMYYVYYVSPKWSYMYLYIDIDVAKLLLSYVFQILLAVAIDWENENVSGFAVQLLYIVMMTPLLSYYGLDNQSNIFMIFSAISFLLTIFFVKYLPYIAVNRIIAFKKHIKYFIFFMCIILIGIFLFLDIRKSGFNIGVLNIVDSNLIYGIREGGSGVTGALGYLYGWMHRVVIPLFAAYSLHKKNIVNVVLAIFVSLVLYITNPHKEILLGVLFVIALYVFGKNKKYSVLLIIIFSVCILGGLVLFVFFDLGIAGNGLNILMRVFHIPASIKFLHFEYFSMFPKLYFSEGKLGRILGVSYPYDTSVGRVVGRYFKGVDTNNNTGYIAYAYDDFGYIGMILASIILAVFLKCIDKYVTEDNKKWITAGLAYAILMLNDAPLLQWFLTGGGLFIAVIIYGIYGQGMKVKDSLNKSLR